LLSLATIVAAVFVLGAVLLLSATAQRVLERWTSAAELSVFLDDGVVAADRARIERMLRASEVVAEVRYVSAAEAGRRFAREFPDLASLATSPGAPPLPSSFEVRLRAGTGGEVVVGALVASLSREVGVNDVRYDRGLIDRIARGVTLGRRLALAAAIVLALAAALAILSVVRLSYVSRRDEVEVLTLVGAPFGAIRGPFVAEGFLQGTLGAVLAVCLLAVAYVIARARYGVQVVEATGLDTIPFLSPWVWIGVVVASGALGALAGAVAVERRLTELA
jgi:cell division transport system permease protein